MNVDPEALNAIVKGSTMRDYFKEILLELWNDPGMFSGKRPLGNSDWDCEVSYALIKSGYVKGEITEDGEPIVFLSEDDISEGWCKEKSRQYLDACVTELIENHLLVK